MSAFDYEDDDSSIGSDESDESEEGEQLDPAVEECLRWTSEEVADWVVSLGFPEYRDCFLSNAITGRRLIIVDASLLPKIGITNFEHIKELTKAIRELLRIELMPWDRSISLPHQDIQAMFLERKCPTGEKSDKLTYKDFSKQWPDLKFQPPLSNYCGLLPKEQQ